jgi:hypothetical protein
MAICKSCGKKYSKWTTPVSARGVCRDCFESELAKESEAKAKEHPSISDKAAVEQFVEPSKWTPSVEILIVAAIFVAALLLTLFISFILGLVHSSLNNALRATELWVGLIANLVIVFVTFPKFQRTKDRAFLFLAIGALSFAYVTIWSLLLGIKTPFVAITWTRTSAELYSAMRFVVEVTGLISYMWGVVLIARRPSVRNADAPNQAMKRIATGQETHFP